MSSRIVAFPGTNSGLQGELVGHFGHTNSFVTIKFEEDTNKITEIVMITNPPHQQGGCMRPVMLLKNAGITDVVLGGIGMRPLQGFHQVGIRTYRGIQGTVQENFNKLITNQLELMENASCNHH